MSTADDGSSGADRVRPVSLLRTAIGRIVALPAMLLIAVVRVYQWTLSPFIGRQCRFAPTCSEYFIQAVRKYGAIVGCWRGVGRILRCHPFHPGGYDPP
jgi:putative membrane protein insertion efficiency factor